MEIIFHPDNKKKIWKVIEKKQPNPGHSINGKKDTWKAFKEDTSIWLLGTSQHTENRFIFLNGKINLFPCLLSGFQIHFSEIFVKSQQLITEIVV